MARAPEVICYSKTGNSRELADQIVAGTKGNLQVITTPRYRWPIIGWLLAGRDGLRGAPAALNEDLQVPDADGLAVLVGPVWMGKPAGPLNTVVDDLKSTDVRVAVALTCSNPKEDTAPLDAIQTRLGRPLVAKIIIANGRRNDPASNARLNTFVLQCGVGEEWQG